MALYYLILLTIHTAPVLVFALETHFTPVMEALLITYAGAGAVAAVALFETCIPALRNAPQPERFVF